jgi:hypothetical protein
VSIIVIQHAPRHPAAPRYLTILYTMYTVFLCLSPTLTPYAICHTLLLSFNHLLLLYYCLFIYVIPLGHDVDLKTLPLVAFDKKAAQGVKFSPKGLWWMRLQVCIGFVENYIKYVFVSIFPYVWTKSGFFYHFFFSINVFFFIILFGHLAGILIPYDHHHHRRTQLAVPHTPPPRPEVQEIHRYITRHWYEAHFFYVIITPIKPTSSI